MLLNWHQYNWPFCTTLKHSLLLISKYCNKLRGPVQTYYQICRQKIYFDLSSTSSSKSTRSLPHLIILILIIKSDFLDSPYYFWKTGPLINIFYSGLRTPVLNLKTGFYCDIGIL